MALNHENPYGPEITAVIGQPPEDPYKNMTEVRTVTEGLQQGHRSIELPPRYNKIHSGKVRDTYEHPDHPECSIIVATDRISTHDVVHNTSIPNKGVVLTQMSHFWFDFLKNNPGTAHIKTHIPEENITLPDDFPAEHRERAMVVKKLMPLPLEAIVRGYLYGSVMSEYEQTGKVCGIPVKSGLLKAGRFDTPLFTPSTKGAVGQHDENMTGGEAELIARLQQWECPQEIPGLTEKDDGETVLRIDKIKGLVDYISASSLLVYLAAAKHAEERGIILADTKFEWALDKEGNIVLIDEVLTPDSSRFWESNTWESGKEPVQFDKQPLRADAMKQWAASGKTKEKPPLFFSLAVVREAQQRYIDIQDRLAS